MWDKYGSKDASWWPKRPPRGSVQDDHEPDCSGVHIGNRFRSAGSFRNAGEGLGWSTSLGSKGTPPIDAEAHNSDQMMVLVWNAGDLDRRVKGDALIRAIGGCWSILLLQEADSIVLPTVLEERGISFTRTGEDGVETLVGAGASGVKQIRHLYPNESSVILRPWVKDDAKQKVAASYTAVRIRWMQPGTPYWTGGSTTDLPRYARKAGFTKFPDKISEPRVDNGASPATRCGRSEWRAASIHFNHVIAKKRDVVRKTLGEFFGLMIRDSVDMVGGDFNQAHKLLREILEHLCEPTSGAVKYQIMQEDRYPEVALVLFFTLPSNITMQRYVPKWQASLLKFGV